MANWSDTSIVLYGNLFSIAPFNNESRENIYLGETEIHISGQGRWAANLVEILPKEFFND